MVTFEGPRAVEEWIDAVRGLDGGLLSPGAAAAMLGVSRQFIHEVANKKLVRAWAVLERPDPVKGVATASFRKRHTYMVVSYVDIVYYGLRVGRFHKFEDVGFEVGRLTQEQFEEIKQGLDKSKLPAV